MKKNKFIIKNSGMVSKNRRRELICFFVTVLLLSMSFGTCAFAAEDPTQIVNQGFDVVYSIIAAIVSALGSVFLLWGIFEWSTSLNTQDGGAQSIAFKRIASGLVALIGPQLIPLISSAAGA